PSGVRRVIEGENRDACRLNLLQDSLRMARDLDDQVGDGLTEDPPRPFRGHAHEERRGTRSPRRLEDRPTRSEVAQQRAEADRPESPDGRDHRPCLTLGQPDDRLAAAAGAFTCLCRRDRLRFAADGPADTNAEPLSSPLGSPAWPPATDTEPPPRGGPP